MKYLLTLLILVNLGCKKKVTIKKPIIDKEKIYTQLSKKKNKYINFNSPNAINEIAAIENEYFNNYNTSFSKYYGTVWYQNALRDSLIFKKYKSELNIKPDSMHCTIYAMKSLNAGLGKNNLEFKNRYKKIWEDREYAGWSVAYILTKYFNWNAYLIISKQSSEYEYCLKNYKKDKKYHVWKQPNIDIKKVFDFDKEKTKIDSLLKSNEYGWGFSNQGWHTWITRYDTLKECNWSGAPSKKYNITNAKPLFLKTKFTNFSDYQSHIIAFPPKEE